MTKPWLMIALGSILILAGVGWYLWPYVLPITVPEPPKEVKIADGVPTLMEFGMNHCVSCKAMHKVLEELRAAHGDQLNVVSINIMEQGSLAKQWKIVVIPTQVLLDGEGNEFFRHVGFLSAQAIRERFVSQGFTLGGRR